MRIELIRAPQETFLQILFNNIRPSERNPLDDVQWGAVGLIQAKLIDLYWAADVAAKASDVVTAMVTGNCPQHIQILAIFGKQTGVQTALNKVREDQARRLD